MTALFLQFLSLVLGTAALTLLLLVYREQRRRLALRYALVLGSIWLLAFSYLLHQLELLTGRVELFLAAALLNSLGSLAYIVLAPPFYHALLGKPLTRPWRYGYTILDLLLLLLAAGLAWERYRGLAVMVLHILLFIMALYGVSLITIRYRLLAEARLRRAAGAFALLVALFLPPLYLEPRPQLLAPFIHSHWTDAVALPLFLLFLSALSIPFILTYLRRPPFIAAGQPTAHFLRIYAVSPREGRLLSLLAKGKTQREIAEALELSEGGVESMLSEVNRKTGTDSRAELVGLLLANR